VTKMLIDIDEEALEAAADLLGTTTKKDTVNMSLRETARRLRRAQALAKLAERGEAGDFDDLLAKSTNRP
jgi:Arc/MetJ family transcription regulator